jgi:hypothetical protein
VPATSDIPRGDIPSTAIHQRIRDDFSGSMSRFLDWYDANGRSLPSSTTTPGRPG